MIGRFSRCTRVYSSCYSRFHLITLKVGSAPERDITSIASCFVVVVVVLNCDRF